MGVRSSFFCQNPQSEALCANLLEASVTAAGYNQFRFLKTFMTVISLLFSVEWQKNVASYMFKDIHALVQKQWCSIIHRIIVKV